MNTATFRIVNPLSKSGADKGWGQSYFYIDLYLAGEVGISFNAGWSAENNIKKTMGQTSSVDTYVKSIKAYDLATGAELTDVNLMLTENQNKWIRLEILTNGAADKQTVSTSSQAHMRFCNGWYFESFAEGAAAYFKNPMIRTTKLEMAVPQA